MVTTRLENAQATVKRVQGSSIGRFVAKYSNDQADDHATLIAFSALFSLFPMIGALLTLLGFLIQEPDKLEELVDTINKLFPSQVADLLDFLQETRQISGLLGIASFLGLLWTSSFLFGRMGQAFNRFYGLKNRGLVGEKLMAFIMIFVFLGLIVVSVAGSSLTAFLAFSTRAAGVPVDVGLLQSLLGWALSIGSAFLMFLVIYRVVPNGPLKLSGIWQGALLAAILFAIINQLFPLYLRFFGGGFAAYKTLGLFLLLMTWFYFLARILVLGCELNAFLHPAPPSDNSLAEPAPIATEASAEEPSHGNGFGQRALRLAAILGVVVLLRDRIRQRLDLE